MQRKPRILVVGSLVMDLIVTTPRFPGAGETVLGTGFQMVPGGKGANQAIQAARLGAQVTMVGKVGHDAFGDTLVQSLLDAGVDASHVLRSETKPSAIGNVQIEVQDMQVTNRIVVVPGANMTITPDDVAYLQKDIQRYDLVMLQLEIPMEINCLIAAWAYEKGIPVMLNSAPYAPIPPELLRCITYISPNEHEAKGITGIAVNDDNSILRALQKMREEGIQCPLITLGSRGAAMLDNGNELLLCPALENLPVQDPTAAGDSFVGAFCTAICLNAPYIEAMRFATHTAGITVCRMGAQSSLPHLQEVLDSMQCFEAQIDIFDVLK